MELRMTPWIADGKPTEEDLRNQLAEEELTVYNWSAPAQGVLEGHTHGYHKVLVVVSGSIKFEFPTRHKTIKMNEGDRLDLPAGIRHNAVVGISGVSCLEAHIY